MKKAIALLITLALVSSPAFSGDEAAGTDKPSITASMTATITASVEAINHETRELTLRGPKGNTVSFVAGEDARNLDQVGVGDIVTAEYEESVAIDVFADEGIEPGVDEIAMAGRSEEGEMPAGIAMDAVVITAIVEEIDLEANTFKLKGPEGEIKEYTARDPENLKKAAVGDLVVITLTKSIALSVEKAAEE